MKVLSGAVTAFAMALTVAPVAAQTHTETDTVAAEANDVLRPGDVVRLRIWRHDDISGEYQVDENGQIVFPLIGPVHVVERSPDELKRQLIEQYRVYLRAPSIDVTLLRRINVLGSVTRPGLYTVDPTMTVADAIALAGGVTAIGNSDRVNLIRAGEVLTTRLSQASRIGELPIRSGDQFYVPERSWISRNSNIVAATITGTISLVIALIRL